MSTSFAQENQGLVREVFPGIPGTDLASLTNHATFPDNPTSTNLVTDAFEAPIDVMDEYGQRMHGFLVAPATGDYTFWIASDDASTLFLSTDADPANTRPIASVSTWTSSREWTKEANQKSDPISLNEGQAYYVSALMKEGGGGDNLAVRWELPNGDIEEPIPGSRLLPFGISFEAPSIAEQPQDQTAVEGGQATFHVAPDNIGPVQFQWLVNDNEISGATGATYIHEPVQLDEDGSQFQVRLSNDQGTVLSEPAMLTVSPDTAPPSLIKILNIGTDQLEVTFSEPVATESATDPAHYGLDQGLSVTDAEMSDSPERVLLSTSPLSFGTQYTLTVNDVLDVAATPNPIATDSQLAFTAVAFAPVHVGDASVEGGIEPIDGGHRLTGAGTDIGGESDQFMFSYRKQSGDFDIQVRVAELENTDSWAKAGLLARESLERDAPYAAMLATPSISGSFFSYRRNPGEASEETGNGPVNYPYTWLRLQRQGDSFKGFAGYNGSTWYEIGSTTVDLPQTLFFGMGVSSRSENEPATAQFVDLTESANATLANGAPDVEPPGPTSRLTGLAISEIMYHPAGQPEDPNLEFIEIFNSEPYPEDIGGYRITGDVEFTFPQGTTLPGGGFMVVAADPDAVQQAYGLNQVFGPYTGELPNDNGDVHLRHRNGGALLRVEYDDTTSPWPVAADGAGHSLVLARPSHGQNNPRSWGSSDAKGGSPGHWDPFTPEPLDNVRINEFLAHTDDPVEDFIELYNHGRQEIDLSDCSLSDDPAMNRFVIPEGTVIPANGFITFRQSELGFALSSEGERIYLVNPDSTRVIDAVRFMGQQNGVSTGRFPDGAAEFHELKNPTPDAANADLLIRDIVINELMYHPLPDDEAKEFLELYNRGSQTVDLGGWRLMDGIDFTLPEGVQLEPDSYLVVAKDADRIRADYPALPSEQVVGNYDGVLADGGERVALAMPDFNVTTNQNNTVVTNSFFVVVDEVRYHDGGRWGKWADGGGSSLELVDPRSDNRRASNWAESDETGKSEWTTIEHTGRLDLGRGDIDELQVFLLGDGECLVDDLEVRQNGGNNRVPNPDFESGFQGWVAEGNHIQSGLSGGGQGFDSNRSLHIRATGGGDNGANRTEIDLSTPLNNGETGTIRGQARWLRGQPDLLLRLHGNHLEAVGHLNVPANLGTPGAPNSQSAPNRGPAIFDVTHHPILPQANEDVVVTARVHDPDGLDSVQLRYRVDPSSSISTTAMNDNGDNGDAVAGDGTFSARIPGRSGGTLVAFHVRATDSGSSAASTQFPLNAPERECLVRFGDPQLGSNFGTYRLWITEETADEWTNRQELSNEPLDATFVYGDFRVVYNASAHYRGSPFVRPSYGSPTGSLTAYIFNMPKDDLVLGTDEFNMDSLEQPGRDPTLQREKMSFWIGEQIGLPITHQRYVHLFVNGVRRGEVYSDSQQINGDFFEGWFFGNDEGDIFKIDDWFEYDDVVRREFNVNATLENFTTTGGVKKKARYRWSWEKKANRGLDDNYQPLFSLVDALHTPGDQPYTRAVESLVDVDQWMRTFATRHIVADWDGYGYNRGKNQFSYKPPRGGWKMLLWDLDFSLGGGSDGPTANLFSVNDSTIARMYNHPPFRRAYFRALYDAVNGPLQSENFNRESDAIFRAFQANNVEANGPRTVQTWVGQRRNYIQSQLDNLDAPFTITSNNGNDFTTDQNLVTLTGTAPVQVQTLQVNGVAYPLTWTGVTDWQMRVPLDAGVNALTLSGLDSQGNTLPDMTGSIEVTFTGDAPQPQDNLVINEIMYHSAEPGAEFLEIHNRSSTHTMDLSGYRIDAVDLTFPDGTLLGPEEYLVAARDPAVYVQAYPNAPSPVAQFPGRLDNTGETVRLVQPGQTADQDLLIDEVTYDEILPWPAAADGQGPSLQLVDADRDNRRVGNWTAAEPPASNNDEPQTVLELDSTWTYNQSGNDLGSAWKEPDFDDSGWSSGPGLLYVEDSTLAAPKNTPLTLGQTTYYFRTTFNNDSGLSNPALQLTTFIDDGAVVYLNGNEVFRLGMPPGAVSADTYAERTVSDASQEGPFSLPSEHLQPGENVLAVEVHQTNSGSSDIVLGAQLVLEPVIQGPFTPGRPNSVRDDLPAFPLVWINEIQPVNQNGITDSHGNADPWVELYNAGSNPVDLQDFHLSPDYTNLAEWSFPSGATIEPGTFKLVWLDAQPGQSTGDEWHAGFSLAPSSGSLALSRQLDDRLIVIDHLDYENAQPDQSFGLFPDGQPDDPRIFLTPSPGAANTLESPAITLWINEWMALNTLTVADPADAQFDDWFELYNPGGAEVNLSGYTLTDDLAQPDQFAIPAGTAVPAGGFLLVWADGDPAQTVPGGALHTNFRLDGDGEAIALFAPDGTKIDSVTFTAQTDDISQGRFPDGAAEPFVFMQTPTPAGANQTGSGDGAPEIDPSALAVTPDGEITLAWSTEPGMTYVVQYKENLSDPNWTDLEEITADGNSASVSDPLSDQTPQRFYRIVRMDQ